MEKNHRRLENEIERLKLDAADARKEAETERAQSKKHKTALRDAEDDARSAKEKAAVSKSR